MQTINIHFTEKIHNTQTKVLSASTLEIKEPMLQVRFHQIKALIHHHQPHTKVLSLSLSLSLMGFEIGWVGMSEIFLFITLLNDFIFDSRRRNAIYTIFLQQILSGKL